MSTTTSAADSSVADPGSGTTRAAWAATGALAGLAGVVAIQASGGVSAVYDEDTAGDPGAIVARLTDQRTFILVEHISMTVSALALLVFAAGLARLLSARLGSGSILPGVAAGGLVATSAVCLIGTGLTTELVFGLSAGSDLVPEFAVVAGHWFGTIPWLWAAAGVSALAVAVASLRHGAVPRWLGWASLVLGGLTALFGVSPLQYMAGFTGPFWVLVCATGLWITGRTQAA
ncbi:hypothetical protein [Rhodococcus triatomae]|nr:hypothetical protein G419_18569 [Rhodococcus triatomae BKS 15-14]